MYVRYGDLSWETMDTDGPPEAGRPLGGIARNGRASGARLPVVRLNGVQLHAITEEACIRHILMELDAGRGGVVVTPNLDHLRRCVNDVLFAALIAEADLVVADGMPLVWASRLQGTPLPERVAGSDLVSSLSAAAHERGRSIFLLGGAPGTAEGAARVLRDRHPGINLAGIYCPPYGFDRDDQEVTRIVEMMRRARPDIAYVALGSPKQELLIDRLKKISPGTWWLGVGNSFSFLSGEVKRAPRWMQRWGVEWIHRLLQEPRRLFRRYIMLGVPFATALLGRSIIRGLPNRLRRRRPAGPGLSLESRAFDRAPIGAAAEIRIDPNHLPGAEPADGGSPGTAVIRSGAADGNGGVNGLISIARATISNGRSARELVRSDGSTVGLARLRALVLLGGTVRPTPLTMSIGRSVLDLPLNDGGSILNHWMEQSAELAGAAGLAKLPVRIMVDWNSPEPLDVAPQHLPALRVERDRTEYRGTGGVLHDLAGDYDDDDLILVGNAAQVLVEGLSGVVESMRQTGGDVSLVSHEDGTPSGLMLIRCAALRSIPRAGFVDMKEQALPTIASHFAVRVVSRRRPTGLPVRSLNEYITALKHYHRKRLGKGMGGDLLAEDWRATFGIVEPGADVDPLARLHDSVVLRGGRVEAGAVLVRCVICPGGMVKRDRSVVDLLIAEAAERHPQRDR